MAMIVDVLLAGLLGLLLAACSLLACIIIHSIVSAAPSRARVSDNVAWEGGSQQQVTWSFTGAVPEVHITLYSVFNFWNLSDMFVSSIAYNIKNHSSHVLTVPTGLVPGKYYLKIRSTRDDRISATSPIFTIDKMATPPEINGVAIPRCLVAVGRLQT